MTLFPVSENEASAVVKESYRQIREGLGVPSIPLFFQYFGAFPEYLDYVAGQITKNLTSPEFEKIISDTLTNVQMLTSHGLSKSDDLQRWLTLYKNAPSFYNFQQDLKNILKINLQLAFIFISLREAVKGWAVAAKKLPNSVPTSTAAKQPRTEDDFIYEDLSTVILGRSETTTSESIDPNRATMTRNDSSSLATSQSRGIEKDLLPEYLNLCKFEFRNQMKFNKFWTLRIGLEKIILNNLAILPALIFSPINLFIQMNEKYPNYGELLYLISEHFPTYAAQRLMFSAFLVEN